MRPADFPFGSPIVLRPALGSANVASLTQYLPSETSGIDFQLTQKRTLVFGSGAGSRFEWNDFRYGEPGYVHQTSYNILSALSVPGQTPCQLTSQVTLNKCALSLPAAVGVPAIPSHSNYDQQGVYFLGTWTQP